MGVETIVPVVAIVFVFGGIAAIVIVPAYFRERTKQSAHRLISEAIAKGQSLDPALMERLTDGLAKQQSSPRRTLGSAVVMLALGAAFATIGYLDGGWGDNGYMNAPAFILGALGLAFLVLAIVDYSSQAKKQKTDQ